MNAKQGGFWYVLFTNASLSSLTINLLKATITTSFSSSWPSAFTMSRSGFGRCQASISGILPPSSTVPRAALASISLASASNLDSPWVSSRHLALPVSSVSPLIPPGVKYLTSEDHDAHGSGGDGACCMRISVPCLTFDTTTRAAALYKKRSLCVCDPGQVVDAPLCLTSYLLHRECRMTQSATSNWCKRHGVRPCTCCPLPYCRLCSIILSVAHSQVA